MQQRRLRLGDILDDYCPRERRITNHAVVAMIEEDVKQTRCTTCDAEHEYKGGKAPIQRRRRNGVLGVDLPDDGRPRAVAPTAPARHDDDLPPMPAATDSPDSSDPLDEAPLLAAEEPAPDDVPEDDEENVGDRLDESREDEGPVHRRLIRATLPRPEGQPPDWKEPDFTMRQGREANGNRNGHRAARGRHARQGQGGQSRPGQRQDPRHDQFGPMRSGHGGNQSRFGGGQGQRQQGSRQGQGQPNGNRPPQGNRGRKRGR